MDPTTNIPAPVTPPVEVPPTTQKTNLALIILLPLLLLSLGLSGFLFYQNQSLSKQIADIQSPQIQPTPATPSTSTTNQTPDPDTVNWKTYNLTHSSFKYPTYYYLDTKVSSNSSVTIYTSEDQNNPNRYYLSISEYNGSVQDLVNTKAITQDQLSEVVIGKNQGYQITGNTTPGGVSETSYAFDNPPIYTLIRFSNYPNKPGYVEFKQIVDKILSTFNFTN